MNRGDNMDTIQGMNVLIVKPVNEYGTGQTITVSGKGYTESKACTSASNIVFLIPNRPNRKSDERYTVVSSKSNITKYVRFGFGDSKYIEMDNTKVNTDEDVTINISANDSTLSVSTTRGSTTVSHANKSRAISNNGSSSSNQGTLAFGSVISIPSVTTDAAGHVSGIVKNQYTLPSKSTITVVHKSKSFSVVYSANSDNFTKEVKIMDVPSNFCGISGYRLTDQSYGGDEIIGEDGWEINYKLEIYCDSNGIYGKVTRKDLASFKETITCVLYYTTF